MRNSGENLGENGDSVVELMNAYDQPGFLFDVEKVKKRKVY